MVLTLAIPDDLARRPAGNGSDVARRILASFAVEEYRASRLSGSDLCRLLGFQTRFELGGLLKDRSVYHAYDLSDLERDGQDLSRAGF